MGRPKKIIATPTLPLVPANLEVNGAALDEIKQACADVGLTLKKSLQVILDAQSATKVTVDKFGDEHEEPDHDKRLRAAKDHLELEGYYKNKNIVADNSKHTHVTYSWQPVQVINTMTDTAGNRIDGN